MDAAARIRARQLAAFEEREAERVWWEAFRESRSMGIPQADARDRADTMRDFFRAERARNRAAALPPSQPGAEESKVRFLAQNMAEVAKHFRAKAETEDTWAERARSAHDKRRAEIRAEAFREVAGQLDETEIATDAA